MVTTTNIYAMYKTQTVQTMTPGELIVLLYEELGLRINRAILQIKRQKWEDAHKSIVRAEEIVLYLTEILDLNYPIADELLKLYEFMYRQLVQANGDKGIPLLEDVAKIAGQLKEVWKEAESLNRQKVASGRK